MLLQISEFGITFEARCDCDAPKDHVTMLMEFAEYRMEYVSTSGPFAFPMFRDWWRTRGYESSVFPDQTKRFYVRWLNHLIIYVIEKSWMYRGMEILETHKLEP